MQRLFTAIAGITGLLLCLCTGACSNDKRTTEPDKNAAADRSAAADKNAATDKNAAADKSAADKNTAPAGQGGAGGSEARAPAGPGAPYYFDRPLDKSELRDRSLRELSIMRNTIFALGGNKFRKSWLRQHFTAQPWYKPSDTLDKSKISDTDWANVKVIAEVERSFSKNELKERQTAILSAIGTGVPTPEQRVELQLLSTKLGKWVGPESVAREERSPLADPTMLDKLLTLEQIEDMSRRDLRLLRNTIYARRGYPFKSDILDVYFSDMDWYEVDENYTDKRLTSVDWKNIKLVKSVENTLGGPISDNEHGEEIGWFDGA